MESKINYTVVGLFVVLLSIALIVIVFWLSGNGTKTNHKTYLVLMNEAVSGLSLQAPVKFNGVDVGSVTNISLNPKNPQQVKLLLSINADTPITTSTVATLMAQGVTGLTYVGLKAKSSVGEPLMIKPGEEYPIIASEPSFLVQMDTVLKGLTDNLNSLSENFSEIFNAQNREALKETLTSLDVITRTLANNSQNIDSTIRAADQTFQNTAIASRQLPGIMSELKTTLNSVQTMTQSVEQTSTQVNNFSQQALPNAVDTMNRLKNITANLQTLTQEISNNPSVIMRGKQLPPPGPGEY